MGINAFGKTAHSIVDAVMHIAVTFCESRLVLQYVLDQSKYFGQKSEIATRNSVWNTAEGENACLDEVMSFLAESSQNFDELVSCLFLNWIEELLWAKLKAVAKQTERV